MTLSWTAMGCGRCEGEREREVELSETGHELLCCCRSTAIQQSPQGFSRSWWRRVKRYRVVCKRVSRAEQSCRRVVVGSFGTEPGPQPARLHLLYSYYTLVFGIL